ncbi:MAG: HflK protein [Francisellaceae bacterium]|nr:HflK protein [Francisellaceae bacterium]
MSFNLIKMVWNEPGKGNNNPWKPRQTPNSSPPDLEKILKKLINILSPFKTKGNKGNSGPTTNPFLNLIFFIVALTLVYIISGIYIVNQNERAVVTRFGKFLAISEPGPHWLIPLIDEKEMVPFRTMFPISHTGEMLTEDENIVSVEIAVHYFYDNARDYLFNVDEVEETIKQASGSALRQVIGYTKLNDVITSGQAKIANDIKKQLQEILDIYQAGVIIESVALQYAMAPTDVRDAFDEVIKARETKISLSNKAQAYANEVLARAEGQAKRISEEAKAYKEEIVLNALGNTARFNLMLPEYLKFPAVTRTRLYLDTMEQVLTKSSKVLLDIDKSQPFVYLPLDKIMGHNNQNQGSSDAPLSKIPEVFLDKLNKVTKDPLLPSNYNRGF